MRLACLSSYLPYRKVTHAGGQFSWAWLCALSRQVDVELVVPATRQNTAAPRDLPDNVDVTMVPLANVHRKTSGRLHSYATGSVTPGLAVLRGFRSSEAFRAAVARADVVEIHWQHLLPLVDDVRSLCEGVPVTAIVADVLSQKLFREARYARSMKKRIGSSLRIRRARSVEARFLQRVDHVFTFSGKDKVLLEQLGVTTPIDQIDPPVYVPADPVAASVAPVVSFTGAMSRSVNAESVAWFLERVWPGVLSTLPEAKFVVAGADPPQWLVERSGPNVVVTGYVEDLAEVYRSSALFVAPLRTGAGVKFKVLDAMAYGLPVVATSVGAEGIAEEAGTGAFAAITDDPSEMAERIASFLSNPQARIEVGARARAWIQDRFDFGASMDQVMGIYSRLSAVSAG